MLDSISYTTPHKFVSDAYSGYLSRGETTPSTNGRIFEYLICETLAREDITPFYYQARFDRVPNADFDVVLYDQNRPVVLTMKTSLRERYKQSVLEGWALWQVYRNAETWLITLEENEAPNVQLKIESGDIVGVNGCILASSSAYDDLLAELRMRQFKVADSIKPLQGKIFPS